MSEDEYHSGAGTLLGAAEALVGEKSSAGVLDRIAERAPRVVPGAEYASVTVATRKGLRTAAATCALPRRIHAIQYELDEGPCVAATQRSEVVSVPDVPAEPRWPRFAVRIASTGAPVGSILAVPLRPGARITASLNVASPDRGAFRDVSTVRALLFAAIAGLALRAVTEREDGARRARRVRELEDFSAVLGHDLRSGVTGVLAAAAVVACRRDQLDSARQQAVDLLGLARTRADAAPHSVALLPLVDRVLAELRARPSCASNRTRTERLWHSRQSW